jgi:hypothetical protein
MLGKKNIIFLWHSSRFKRTTPISKDTKSSSEGEEKERLTTTKENV